MTKQEAMKIIKESNTTYLLNYLIHGKGRKQLKECVRQELIKRGSIIN